MRKEKERIENIPEAEEVGQQRTIRTMTPEEKMQYAKLLDELEGAVGSNCELRGADNLLVLLGVLERVEPEKGAITIASYEGNMPPVIFNTPFKLIVRPRGEKNLVFNGKICGSSKLIWKLDCLSRYFFNESRNYFRQPTDTTVYATCINTLYRPTKESLEETVQHAKLCRVMDISLQGIQLRAKEEYFKEGDWLLLSKLVLISDQNRAHNFICKVCRSGAAGRGEFMFGCQFDFLSDQQQDTLCTDIFTLHRQDIQACRLG